MQEPARLAIARRSVGYARPMRRCAIRRSAPPTINCARAVIVPAMKCSRPPADSAAVPADLSGALSVTKPDPQARQIAQWMLEQPAAVFLGNEAQHHAAAASLERMVQALAERLGEVQAHPFEAELASLGEIGEWQAEWKWDGIRSQIIRRAGQSFIWSRGEELVTDRYPELAALAERLPDGTAVDGEILPWGEAGVLPTAVEPWSAKVLRNAGSCATLRTAAASLSTMAGGVPAGAKMPFHSATSNPGSASPIAGTLGRRAARALVVTPRARSLPFRNTHK